MKFSIIKIVFNYLDYNNPIIALIRAANNLSFERTNNSIGDTV